MISWKVFESDLLKFTGDPRFLDILKVLAIGLEYSQTPSGSLSLVPSREPSLSVFDYQRLCNVLTGYKFAELLVLRENIGNRVLKSIATKDIYLPPSSNARNIPYVCFLCPARTLPSNNFCSGLQTIKGLAVCYRAFPKSSQQEHVSVSTD